MKKKLASAIIILLFILQLFIACGGENRPDDETSRQYAEEQTAEVLDPNARINKKDSLPADLNFNGQEIRILKRANNQWELDFPNELNGDIVNDAVYDKNIRVQERLNVKFKLGVCPRGDEFSGTIEDIRIICLSGDDVYDLISMNLNMICTYGTSPTTPFFMDLSSMPYLDLEQPWWNTRTIKEISHDGKSYNLVFGDSSFTLISYTTCVFYNKHIYNNYYGDPDELYKIALDGKWTYDVFADKCKEMYEDLNGDGVADVSDQFGLQFDWYIFNNYMLGSSDARMSSRDSEGIVQIDMDMNRLTTFCEKLYDFCYNNPGVKYYPKNEPLFAPLFLGRNMVFSANYLSRAIEYRAMEDDYGILPMPKLDDLQSEYRSMMTVHIVSLSIPKPCKIPETVCAVMEALASDGYRNVTELYYEVALKTKYSRDEYSGQVMDLICSTQYNDFLSAYLAHVNNAAFIVYEVVGVGKSTDIMSYYAKNENVYKNSLEKLINNLSNGVV